MKKNKYKKDIEEDSLLEIGDDETICPFCGVGNLVHKSKHPFLEDTKGDVIYLKADVCTECKECVLSEKDMTTLLNERDRRQGKGYIKTTVKNGKINRLIIH